MKTIKSWDEITRPQQDSASVELHEWVIGVKDNLVTDDVYTVIENSSPSHNDLDAVEAAKVMQAIVVVRAYDLLLATKNFGGSVHNEKAEGVAIYSNSGREELPAQLVNKAWYQAKIAAVTGQDSGNISRVFLNSGIFTHPLSYAELEEGNNRGGVYLGGLVVSVASGLGPQNNHWRASQILLNSVRNAYTRLEQDSSEIPASS